MSCERYEEGLIDQALGAPAAPEVQAHLAGCAACQARLEEEQRLAATMDGILTSTLDVAPPLGFDLAIKRRVSGTRSTSGAKTLAWISVGLAAAAALILAVLLRPSPPPKVPAVTENVRPPQTTSTPEAVPTTAPVVADERTASVVTPLRAMRQRAPRPAEPEVLVPPTQAALLQRHLVRFKARTAPEAVVTNEPALPFASATLEAGALDELPRLSTSDDVPAVEPPTPLNRLATGGDV
jgi:anti-sigma factor RsiW